jgi:hypothetical protein
MSDHYYLDDCSQEDIFSFAGENIVKANLIKEAIKEAVNQEIPRVIENMLKAKNINITLQCYLITRIICKLYIVVNIDEVKKIV